ncbi:hypothetical protein [Treponema sp.]|uniref:hypothetical protein n=1 Tax=Treponema sp. TaxID=166 RepID=UPI0038907AF7
MKKLIFPFSVILFSLTALSCDFSLPEKVSVKSSGTYEFSLGGSSISVADKLSVSKLKDILDKDDNSGLSVYDYNPTGKSTDVLQYILNYQIADIPLSITTDSDLGEISFNTTFDAPDLSQTISDSLNLTQTLTVYELGTDGSLRDNSGNSGIPLTFNITSPDFTYMYIRSGTFDISLTAPANVSDDFTMTACVTLTDTNGKTIAGPSTSASLAGGGNLSLDLSGKTLVPNMLVWVSGEISGGTTGTKLDYTVKLSPNNIKFSKITGLTMSNSDLGTNGTISIDESFALDGINSVLKSATVESGSLSFSCAYPEGWSGIVIENGTEFNLSGGITIPDSEFTDGGESGYILHKTASLNGKTVTPTNVSTSGSQLVFSLQNATIVFADEGETTSITLAGSCSIDSLSNLIVDISELGELGNGAGSGEIDTGLSFSSLLNDIADSDDSEISNLLKNIEFSGIEGYIFMTYPVENSAIEDLSFNAGVTASYDGGSQTLLSSDTIKMKQTTEDLSSLADSNYMISTDKMFASHDNDADNYYSAELTNVTELLNDLPDNLKIAYNLTLSGSAGEITLEGDALDALTSGSTSISVNIALILPLKIKLNDTYDIPSASRLDDSYITINDVLSLAGHEIDEDLLKRDSADDKSKFKKYTDLIESVSVVYTVKNDTGLKLSAVFYDDQVFTDSDFSSDSCKKLTVSGSQETLTFTGEEIASLFDNYPFCPKIKIAIEADGSEIKVPRSAEFGLANCRLIIKTNGTVDVWEK